MKQKVLSILALLMMTVTGAWADTTVTWTESDMSGLQVTLDGYVADNNTIKGITVTASGGGEGEWFENDINNYSESSTTITFTSSVGNIKSIAIKANDIEIFSNPPGGWTLSNDFQKLSWSGDASSTVSLLLSAGEGFRDISEIVFTIEPDPTYIVAGNNSEIFGIPWDGTYEANKMTKGGDGKYTKTYNVEDAFSDIELKVVKDGEDWIGDETGFNVTFSMKQAGSFTVTLDPNANPVYVTVTGDNVVFADTEYAINYATGMQNGTVTGPDTAKEGDEVTLTITPAAGYVLESISVTGVTTENAVEVTDGKFTMPAEDVNVIATFKSVTYAIFAIDTDGTTQDFGSVEAGATAQKTFTITNSGNKSLYVTISNPEDFTAEMTQNANVYFADALGWGDIHVYYWPNGPEWPGAAMTELYTNELGQKVYCYELPADVEGVIFNGNGNETGDIKEPIGKAYYNKDDKTVGTWSYDNCVPAGMSRVLTVTMNTATLGSKSGNITLSFDAKNATSFTIPCTGEVAAPTPTTYSITVKEGTEDAGNWTVSPNPAEAGQTVTISYTGTKKVKSVKAIKKAAPATARTLAEATAEDCGKVVCAAGHLHDAKTAVPTGCTAVGILGKVTETGHGLILALQDATSQRWNTINGWTSVTTYAGTTLKQLPDDALGSLTSYTTLGSTAVSNWCVAQKSDYEAIFINLGSTAGDYDGTTYDANVNAYITTGVGGTAISGVYWSATDRVTQPDFGWDFNSEYWNGDYRGNPYSLRPVLGF